MHLLKLFCKVVNFVFFFFQNTSMAPSTASTPTGVLFEDDPVETLEASLNNDHEQIEPPKRVKEYRRQIVWKNVILFTTLFLASLYGGYLMITNTKLLTFIWGQYNVMWIFVGATTRCSNRVIVFFVQLSYYM